MKVTKHRDRILNALEDWFSKHEESPTLEDLCRELAMKPSQKGTLQKWLKTMRGIDVEWDDNSKKSLRLLRDETIKQQKQISVKETLHYLTTGLVKWENTDPKKRGKISQALRLGMSRMSLISLLQGDRDAPSNLSEFFKMTEKPLVEWFPCIEEIKYLSSEVTLIEDGSVSDFTIQWAASGTDIERQIQEKVLQDVLIYCRENQLDDAYRQFRKQIITKPVISYPEYKSLLRDRFLGEYFKLAYINLVELLEAETYHFCPRCNYVQKKRSDGSYRCWNIWCDYLATQQKLPPLPTISRKEAEKYKIVTPGIYRYGTLPGIYEIKLESELSKLRIRVTLWPEIDEYDLLVEFDRKISWAIDVKDWSYLDLDRLKNVNYQRVTKETFIVFPDEREEFLRIKVVRKEIETKLKGVRLKLFSEVVKEAAELVNRNSK